jgi:hypothetical protein
MNLPLSGHHLKRAVDGDRDTSRIVSGSRIMNQTKKLKGRRVVCRKSAWNIRYKLDKLQLRLHFFSNLGGKLP